MEQIGFTHVLAKMYVKNSIDVLQNTRSIVRLSITLCNIKIHRYRSIFTISIISRGRDSVYYYNFMFSKKEYLSKKLLDDNSSWTLCLYNR